MTPQQKWWAVTRRYTVEEAVLVQADSAAEAKRLARKGEGEAGYREPVAVSPTTYRKATLIPDELAEDFFEYRRDE